MKRFYYVLAALLFIVVAAGCDSNEPDSAGIRVLTFTVDLEDDGVMNSTGDVVSVQFTVPEITPAVTDHGAVLAYYWDQETWTALPFTYGVENADPNLDAVDHTMTLGYAYADRMLEIFRESSTNAVSPRNIDPFDVKVVIISNFAADKAGIDLRNYQEVKRYFNLPD